LCINSNRGIRSTNESASAIVDFRPAVITGLRVEEVDKGVSYEDGVSVVLAGATVSSSFYWLLLFVNMTTYTSASLIKRIIQQLALDIFHNNLFLNLIIGGVSY
jgi:hypothetical protein